MAICCSGGRLRGADRARAGAVGARAGTAARKCFQLNSSVWASVWDVLASVWRPLGGEK